MTDSTAFAKYYDQITLHLHPQSTVDLELSLIQSHVAPGASVLDIGCGTGRHFLPLQNMDYRVVGIEPNADMRAVLIETLPEALLTETKFLDLDSTEIQTVNAAVEKSFAGKNAPSANFDLIICMWNSLCEICHTESDLKLFATKVSELLKPEGKLLVHLDLPAETQEYQVAIASDGFEYRSEVKEITGQTTTSEETLVVNSSDENKETFTQELVQTWWNQADLEQVWNGTLKYHSGGPLARRSGLYLWFSLLPSPS